MGARGINPTVTDDEIIRAVRELLDEKPEPVVATKDIAARVNMGERGVRNRLNKLADEGQLNRSLIGDSAVLVYWLSEPEER